MAALPFQRTPGALAMSLPQLYNQKPLCMSLMLYQYLYRCHTSHQTIESSWTWTWKACFSVCSVFWAALCIQLVKQRNFPFKSRQFYPSSKTFQYQCSLPCRTTKHTHLAADHKLGRYDGFIWCGVEQIDDGLKLYGQ